MQLNTCSRLDQVAVRETWLLSRSGRGRILVVGVHNFSVLNPEAYIIFNCCCIQGYIFLHDFLFPSILSFIEIPGPSKFLTLYSNFWGGA